MMQGFRDNMKLIILITAIVFLVGFGILELGGVFDWRGAGRSAAGPAGVIAEINGKPIRYDFFQQTYNQMVEQLRQERELREGEDSYVREQAWQQIVRNALMEQEAARRGIKVSPEEIKSAIRFAPPQFLVAAPVFQTNGQFDYNKYLAELDNPNSQVPWAQVEALVAAQLPVQKLQDAVVAGAQVSDGDVRDRFLLQNERLTLRYLRFNPDSFPVDTSRVGGADVESYYKAHPEEFTGPEQAKLEITMIPRVPDASDFSAARERLLPLWEELKASPDSFEARARVYSEISSNVRGGAMISPLPFDQLRPVFQKGLANVGNGQISDILQEERSLHIFRVDVRHIDAKTHRDMIFYHELAIRVQPGAAAIRVAREKVDQLIKEARASSLSEAATKRGYLLRPSPWFARGKSQNEVFQRFPEVENWVFSAPIGAISSGIPSEAGWYVYQILDRQAAGIRPLHKVATDAKTALIGSLALQRAKEVADQAYPALLAGGTEDEVAKRFRGFFSRLEGVTRAGFLGGVGQEAKIVGTLMTVPVGSWSPVLVGKSGAMIFHIDGHFLPTEEEFAKQAPDLRQKLLEERRQMLYVEWLQTLRRNAKVKDYRENYFDA